MTPSVVTSPGLGFPVWFLAFFNCFCQNSSQPHHMSCYFRQKIFPLSAFGNCLLKIVAYMTFWLWIKLIFKKIASMAQASNPSTLGGRGGWITRSRDRDHPGQHGETPYLLKNIPKISWVWWHATIHLATQEAESRESLEPGRPRLQWAEIAPLHSSLGNRARLRHKKIK